VGSKRSWHWTLQRKRNVPVDRWLGSWILLHFALGKRNVDMKIAAVVFIVGLAISALLVYTPFIHFILGR